MDLTGKVAVVTGGASGIGAATAELLAADGAKVAVADIDDAGGRAVAEAIGGVFVPLDVTDRAGWATALDEVGETCGGIDIVHLNAGIMTRPPEAPLDDDILAWTATRYELLRSVNLDGVVYGIEASVPRLEAGGGGDIVVTASISGIDPTPIDPFYTATKHGVVGLVRSIAPALEPRGVRINALCPGAIDTAIVPDQLRQVGIPMAPPAEMAAAVVQIIDSGRTGVSWGAHLAGEPAIPIEPTPIR